MKALNHSARLTTATLLALLLGAYLYSHNAQANDTGHDISKVNGRIEISDGEQVGNVSTVNGGVYLLQGASARSVSTVNGGVELAGGVSVHDIDTVNGDIEIDTEVEISGDVSSVNGDIEIESATSVAGSVSSVNGAIRLDAEADVGEDVRTANGRIRLFNAHVSGNLVTRHGDISLRDGSIVDGDIEFRDQRGWFGRLFGFGFHDQPRLTIDASSAVQGDIHLYHRVDLDIEDGASVGEIIHHY